MEENSLIEEIEGGSSDDGQVDEGAVSSDEELGDEEDVDDVSLSDENIVDQSCVFALEWSILGFCGICTLANFISACFFTGFLIQEMNRAPLQMPPNYPYSTMSTNDAPDNGPSFNWTVSTNFALKNISNSTEVNKNTFNSTMSPNFPPGFGYAFNSTMSTNLALKNSFNSTMSTNFAPKLPIRHTLMSTKPSLASILPLFLTLGIINIVGSSLTLICYLLFLLCRIFRHVFVLCVAPVFPVVTAGPSLCLIYATRLELPATLVEANSSLELSFRALYYSCFPFAWVFITLATFLLFKLIGGVITIIKGGFTLCQRSREGDEGGEPLV